MDSRNVGIWIGTLLIVGACSRTTLKQSHSAADPSRSDEIARMDFWDAVAKERAVCNRDALRALLLQFDLEPGDSDEKAIATARQRGWIRDKDELAPLETARVGWIAKAVCIETGVKGGATMRIFGPRERYAVHELNYRGWLANMTPNQAVSGIQLMALLGAAEDHTSGGAGEILAGAN